MSKNSFIFHLEWNNAINECPAEVKCELYEAIIQYAQYGTVREMQPLAKMAFSFIKLDMDKDKRRYENVCEKNKNNGRLGGRPKKANAFEETERFSENPKEPNGFLENPTKPKKADNEYDYDNDYNNEDDDDNIISSSSKKDEEEIKNKEEEKKSKESLGLIDDEFWMHRPQGRQRDHLDDWQIEILARMKEKYGKDCFHTFWQHYRESPGFLAKMDTALLVNATMFDRIMSGMYRTYEKQRALTYDERHGNIGTEFYTD